MATKRRKGCLAILVVAVLAASGAGIYVRSALAPLPPGPAQFVRFDAPAELSAALEVCEDKRFIRNAFVLSAYAKIKRKFRPVRSGTYKLNPGMDADQVLAALQTPIRQMFRFPETNWAARSANLLEKAGICTAAEYKDLIAQPQLFQEFVQVPLPKKGTLEGYLYPDTYDLPPLLGAKGVIVRQLKAFEQKTTAGFPAPQDLHRAIIVGSMVELEVMRDEERPIVAGVIENRLRLGMPLQIDATILYGLGEWRELTFADYRNADTPYNTYRHKGLPPGPICSPTIKSIRAALNPAKHDFLYYVALPDGRHLFAASYGQHLKNIAKRNAARAALP